MVDAMNFNIKTQNIIKYIKTIITNVKFYQIIGFDILKSIKHCVNQYRYDKYLVLRYDKYLVVLRYRYNN